MRFADSLYRFMAAAALAALASGCAVLTGPQQAPAPAQPPAAAAANTADAAKPGLAGAAVQKEAAPPVEVEAPLPPGVKRAFEAARLALIAGRLDEAERGFLALTKSNPELGGPYANLGVVYRQKQKYEQSVEALERAVQINPKNAVFYNQLGISYRLVGQFTKARDAYEKAIALDPNYALAHLNLGILYDVYLWDSRRALELYDRYLSLSPGGDEKVKKWATDLRHRNQPRSLAARKDQT
jgi:tetratricopeptide (TPR) repeat protein